MKNYLLIFFIFSTLLGLSHSSCGDGVCSPSLEETHVVCPEDCFCGDGICDFNEYYPSCSRDCPISCGDNFCETSGPSGPTGTSGETGNENSFNCPQDCIQELLTCGNGVCDVGETTKNCRTDCYLRVEYSSTLTYALYVVDSNGGGNYVCNMTVWDFSSRLVDEYQMAVVAYGKIVPGPGTYIFEGNCTSGQFTAIALSPYSIQTDFVVATVQPEVCGDGRCVSPEDPSSCPQDCCFANCTGRQCGNDGCGGSCGFCSENAQCVNGICQICTPACSGRNCGNDGCGGSCGVCPSGQQCVNGVCNLNCTRSCTGRNCGSDGCGGSCGSCLSPATCINGICSCTPSCPAGSCGSDGCGGTCSCPSGQICSGGRCIFQCIANCTGKRCGSDGCGGSCGSCSNSETCVNGLCQLVSCSCDNRSCGRLRSDCALCGLCGYGQFCHDNTACSEDWTTSYYVVGDESACPSGSKNCFVGPNALGEIIGRLQSGDDVVVGPGHYCGGFTISTEGVRLSGQPGAIIVPCSSAWWAPAPPNCQAVDGASGTPCSLANSLITLNASSITISGFEFNGKVPNALFVGTPGIQVYSQDGTAIGAGRAIANWVAGQSRTFTQYPVLTILIKNNTFHYFEESAIRLKTATVTIDSNSFSRIGTVGSAVGRRQGKTEKERGSRKDKPGAPVVLDDSSGDVVGNNASNCDYGGLSGGDYPPSSFPFKKRAIDSGASSRQLDYALTQWNRNSFSDMTFGGLIVESKVSGVQTVYGNLITGESGRGLIIENITLFEDSSLAISENSIQGLEIGAWTWKTQGATFSSETYQAVSTGVHLVSCNPYELHQPLAGSYINATETELEGVDIAFYVQDEPASNQLCSTQSQITLDVNVEGGLISDSMVGLQTSGNRISAQEVRIYTSKVATKIQVNPNSLGLKASSDQVPPDCPPTCSGHGECAGIDICECDNGYHNYDCSLQVCGDGFCTVSENAQWCAADCGFKIKKTSITLQFGGLIPKPDCCSARAA